ncbi:TauD/TfdA family dioxygenase [Mycolicibacterium vaccae]|uniref:TauD/TfdA family dioxygenase n=1 Tax=Mycolicibacterium vaccae TaxID=1810 RepID=UPI003CEBF1FF
MQAYLADLDDPAIWDPQALEAQRAQWDIALTDDESTLMEKITTEGTERLGLWSQTRAIDEWREITAPLASIFVRVHHALEGGVGIARLRNLPVRTSNTAIEFDENLLWAIGAHLGRPVNQMGKGKLLARLQDNRDPKRGRDVRPEDTNEPLKHHTDGSDLLMLLCVRQAHEGGNSFISSSARVVREIARRRPDLLPTLLQDYFPFDRNEEQPDGDFPYYLTRLCTVINDRISVRYSRELIDTALKAPGAPQLTEAQRDLLDTFDQIAAEGGAEVDFKSGDLMIINNYSVLHGRSLFFDPEDRVEGRLLLRLWLALADARPLPFDFDRGINTDGAGRGGTPYTVEN